jgi:uncharacterized tellurite resistance protein B-like protein
MAWAATIHRVLRHFLAFGRLDLAVRTCEADEPLMFRIVPPDMLDSLKHFVAELAGGGKPQEHFLDGDYRLAAAALLIHVVTIDGDMSDAERRKLFAILQSSFDLDATATAELVEKAGAADREAVDLYHFTSLINRSLDELGRRRMVEMMWEIIYADGRVTEFEENVLWRASDLLGVSSRERIELRQRVAAGQGAGDPPEP